MVSVNFWVPHLLEALYPPSTLELEVVVRTCCGSVGKPPAPTSRALTSPPWPCHSGSLTSHRPTPQSRAGGLCLRQEELTDGNRACLGTEAGACRPQPRLPGGLCRAGSANRSSALCGWAALAGGGWGSGCPEGGPRSCGRVGTSWRAGISCWHGSVVNVVRTGTSRAGDIRAKGTLNRGEADSGWFRAFVSFLSTAWQGLFTGTRTFGRGGVGWGERGPLLRDPSGVSGPRAAYAPPVSGLGQGWVSFLEDADEDTLVLESSVASADDGRFPGACRPPPFRVFFKGSGGCRLLHRRPDGVPGRAVPHSCVLAPCPRLSPNGGLVQIPFGLAQ